jgi:hypothetical protein
MNPAAVVNIARSQKVERAALFGEKTPPDGAYQRDGCEKLSALVSKKRCDRMITADLASRNPGICNLIFRRVSSEHDLARGCNIGTVHVRFR